MTSLKTGNSFFHIPCSFFPSEELIPYLLISGISYPPIPSASTSDLLGISETLNTFCLRILCNRLPIMFPELTVFLCHVSPLSARQAISGTRTPARPEPARICPPEYHIRQAKNINTSQKTVKISRK